MQNFEVLKITLVSVVLPLGVLDTLVTAASMMKFIIIYCSPEYIPNIVRVIKSRRMR